MKLSHLFLLLSVVVLSLQLSCDKKPTEPDKTPPPAPIVAIYPSSDYMNFPDSIRALFDFTKNPTTLHSILLPYNCPVSFAIVNEGPQESVLNYSIDDIGALGGYLDYTNGVGSLKSGDYATITVTVDPNFTKSGFGGLGGSTLVLSINTPGASNYIKNVVSVHIMDYDVEVQKLCGIWTGTWSGVSSLGGIIGKTTPVNGTWKLNLQSVDWEHHTATGTLTWNGSDAWWSRELNDVDDSKSMPHYYNVDRTNLFNDTTLQVTGGEGVGNPCESIVLDISGINNTPFHIVVGVVDDPSDPRFCIQLSTDFNSIVPGFCTFWSTNHGYYGNSGGILNGSKSQ